MKPKFLLVLAFVALFACQDAETLGLRCDDGNATACSNLGVLYHSGEGVTQDLARAASLYQRACDGGELAGCSNLGVMYQNGEGVTQDLARTAGLFQQACDGGMARGCSNLGVLYHNGLGVTQDFAHAAILYQQGCDVGFAQGCSNLGVLYQSGQGVTRDPARAARLYQQACNGGELVGCSNLGAMYQNGEGVTQDLARTAGLFQQACDGGMVEGCYNLGVLYHSGEGVTQDLARAIILYQQGCDGGFAQGCSNLGLLYYNGEGVTQDLARAASLFQQACDGGESVGCSNLGVMYATADSLFDLAVRASEAGEDSTLHSTAEPALQAYRAFEVLDLDAHYHVGLLGLATGDTALARARADTMEAAVPDHLLATILRIDLARLQGDTASVTRLSLDFLDAYDREMATGRAEYQAHTNVVERRRREADDETVPRTRDTTRTTGMSPPTLLVTDSAALDEVPRLLASPPLQYPDSLLESGIEGVLMLEFVIDTTGKAEPSSITVIESPHPAFNDIAKDAVLASVYSPGRTDDVPVAVRVRESLTFRTKPDTKR